jgi:hypothetical protein
MKSILKNWNIVIFLWCNKCHTQVHNVRDHSIPFIKNIWKKKMEGGKGSLENGYKTLIGQNFANSMVLYPQQLPPLV